MADVHIVEVVTYNPSNKKIFRNGVISEQTDEISLMKSQIDNHWTLTTSHAYIKNDAVHEKYVFVQS